MNTSYPSLLTLLSMPTSKRDQSLPESLRLGIDNGDLTEQSTNFNHTVTNT